MRQAGIGGRNCGKAMAGRRVADAKWAGWRRPVASGLVLSGLLLAGCRSSNKPEGEIFLPEGQIRDVDRAMASQAAVGARADAMLYPRHFDGGELNSLGQSKLHLMVLDKPVDQPLVVYLNLPSSDAKAADRRDAVEKYLRDAGLAAGQIELKDGANPEAFGPAEAGLTRLPKTESGAGGASTTMEPPATSGGTRTSSK